MADCNELFTLFNSLIKLDEDKRQLLINVRNELRDRINSRFPREKINDHTLEFQTQGSFVMDTIITPWDDDFDLDDGIYFIGTLNAERRPPVEDFHKWVFNAVGEDENYGEVTDKDTCIRVRYVKEKFHIDLPIYYATNPETPELAHKKKNWTLSNPVEFIAWFESKVESGFKQSFILEAKMYEEYEKWLNDIRKKDAQLRRIVRYLKAWGDFLRGEMPSGIILTILAAENYGPDDNDDVALRDTLVNINQYLKSNNCQCPRPTTPRGEDLFQEYSPTEKKYFLDRLEAFINSANLAISNPNQMESCLKWQKHLGPRFSCATAHDEIVGSKSYSKPAILGDNAKSAHDRI